MSKTSKNTFQIDTEDSPVGAVIEFLDEHLPKFPSAFKKMTSTTDIEWEDDISQQLCDYLQRRTYPNGVFMFSFQRTYLKSKRASDFGIVTVEHHNEFEISKAFFVIEAKLLPTGNTKEYVKGNYGGIQRYKKGHHGGGLKQSAILGYIQDKDCQYWFEKINEWIEELIKSNTEADISWEKSDLLKEISRFGKTRKYHSVNTRIVDLKTDSIELHHYLIELN